MKVIILIVKIFLLLEMMSQSEVSSDLKVEDHSEYLKNSEINSSEEKFSSSEEAEKYVKEMGLGQAGTLITLANYKEFLMKLFTKGKKVQQIDEDFFKELIEKICLDVPQKFYAKDLKKYLNNHRNN